MPYRPALAARFEPKGAAQYVDLSSWLRLRFARGARGERPEPRALPPYGTLPAKLCECIDEGACVFDRQHRVVYWNPAFLRLRGVAANSLYVGMPSAELLAHAQPFRVVRPGAALTYGRTPLMEFLEWQAATAKIEQEDGTILRISGQRMDADHYAVMYVAITESERTTLAFRDAATRLKATLDNVLDGIVTIDDHGNIDSFSAGAEQLLGYQAGEVIGQNVKLLMPAVHASGHDTYLATYRATRVPHIMRMPREVDARRKDGRLIPVELGVNEISVGNQIRFIGVLHDISERRRAERMQREFVATASHELRTPLTSIIGALGLLRNGAAGPLSTAVQKLIEVAHRNGERLARLVNDILDIEKADSGQFNLALEVLSLRAIAAESVDANQAYATRFGVNLALTPPTSDPACLVDRARLHQILTNLISNAVKFSPRDGQVKVTLSQDHETAVIAVTDHGPGVPQDFRAHLFEKFAQADSSDSRHGGGTGLGLSIAHALVDHMGGHIEVESVEGEGATFRVRLPLATESMTGG